MGLFVMKHDRMKSRVVHDLNLSASGQHFLGVNVTLLTPQISWGRAPKPKPSMTRREAHPQSPLRNALAVIPAVSDNRSP